MTLLEFVYYLTIKPLELFFEVVYMVAYRVIGSPSLAIIALSLAMNFLVLPLYRRADAMQEEERRTEERLGDGVRHIKQAFRGDERMMILQTYYRQHHYKQSYVLRGSLPLLLEIPFFIAAYRFLSSLEILQGVSFGPIADLGAPDGLIMFGGLAFCGHMLIGGMAINFLPILMTLINIVSSSIYADHMSRKTRIQLYVMAAIFLVFLYDSPSGLVFYWTLNNLFSLCKNIVYKLPWPQKSESAQVDDAAGKTTDGSVFLSCVILLTILTGLLIPSAVIGAQPEDFVNLYAYHNPLGSVAVAFALAAGFFLVWCSLFYALAGERWKARFSGILIVVSVMALLDYMIFRPSADSGSMSDLFVYHNGLVVDKGLAVAGLVVILVICVIVALTYRRWKAIWRGILQVICIVTAIMSIMNVVSIRSTVNDLLARSHLDADEDRTIALSQTGQNVVVIMLDRAIGSYLPYIMNELPELQTQFDGFTYYPNTLSYGAHTNYAVPALAGGYEYTPVQLQTRDGSIPALHDEALLSMPVLFCEAGYDVTVVDPPYAGYEEVSDLSIYDDYEGIHAFALEGTTNPNQAAQELEEVRVRKRNLFCYSVMRCMPLAIQEALYNEGQYNAAPVTSAEDYSNSYSVVNEHQATGYNNNFLNSYTALQALPGITVTTDNAQGAYVFMDNNTVHQDILLQEPDYAPAAWVDNTEYDAAKQDRFTVDGVTADVTSEKQLSEYQVMVAALRQLGSWFDYLRENDLYDNTRIIVVSDHADDLGSFSDRVLEDETDTMWLNPLLMVKDYDATGYETDETFMTNADVPTLSVEGVIDNAVNPFTGNAINSDAKDALQYVFYGHDYEIDENRGERFLPGEWLSVHDDVRDASNWAVVSEKSTLPNE